MNVNHEFSPSLPFCFSFESHTLQPHTLAYFLLSLTCPQISTSWRLKSQIVDIPEVAAIAAPLPIWRVILISKTKPISNSEHMI